MSVFSCQWWPQQWLHQWFGSARPPRVLCFVNHYFGPSQGFRGKSTNQEASVRMWYVQNVVNALKALPGSKVVVCGVPGCALIPLDFEFGSLQNPCHLVYASLERMALEVGSWDYFINIEDDVLLESAAFAQVLDFDKENLVNECLLPNRMERQEGNAYCVDLQATPGWTCQFKKFKAATLRVGVSPHSGLSILSQAKLKYALERVDLTRRDTIIGGPMASAYANIHSPFSLYRPFDPVDFVTVVHQDNWESSV